MSFWARDCVTIWRCLSRPTEHHECLRGAIPWRSIVRDRRIFARFSLVIVRKSLAKCRKLRRDAMSKNIVDNVHWPAAQRHKTQLTFMALSKRTSTSSRYQYLLAISFFFRGTGSVKQGYLLRPSSKSNLLSWLFQRKTVITLVISATPSISMPTAQRLSTWVLLASWRRHKGEKNGNSLLL
jgi:hypothetical protein